MAKTSAPKVVVFEEPRFEKPRKSARELKKERDRFLRGDVADIFCTRDSDFTEDKKQKERASDNDIDFRATLREVESLAVSSFDVKEKRKFQEQQIIALGAKPPKSEYVPYPHYQRVAKSKREKEKRNLEQLHCVKSSSSSRSKRRGQQRAKGRGRWKERIRTLEPTLGTFRGGVLKLSRGDVQKVSKSKPK